MKSYNDTDLSGYVNNVHCHLFARFLLLPFPGHVNTICYLTLVLRTRITVLF